MKKLITTFLTLFIVFSIQAQDYKSTREAYLKQRKQDKEKHLDSLRKNFDDYRRQANEEYAQFMRERWEAFQAMQGAPVPKIPEPPQPFERDKDVPIPELPIKFDKVITIPTPTPKPVEPMKRPDNPTIPNTPSLPSFDFSFYGTPLSVHMSNALKIKLKDITENSVADAWQQLSSETSDELLEDCLALRDELCLGDWAYYCMIRDFSEKYFGKGTNEAVVMKTYLMAQSGYNVRIGRKDNNLIILLPFDGLVYEATYLSFSGICFYDIDSNKGGTYYTFNRSFTKNDRVLSLRMPRTPKFAFKSAGEKTYTSKRYPDMTVTMSTNKNLIDFYNGYPKCQWTNYSWAGLSDEVKAKLYPMLRANVAGKGQIEASNRIINFVQTAFSYQTDDQQFVTERSLFPDETFFYPYCDCEDRSILFSVLMHDILGLDVVLLHYPEHLATAVHFTEELKGTYLTLDNKTYYVSDPTYIGANVGECMPRYTKTNPQIYKLY